MRTREEFSKSLVNLSASQEIALAKALTGPSRLSVYPVNVDITDPAVNA